MKQLGENWYQVRCKKVGQWMVEIHKTCYSDKPHYSMVFTRDTDCWYDVRSFGDDLNDVLIAYNALKRVKQITDYCKYALLWELY